MFGTRLCTTDCWFTAWMDAYFLLQSPLPSTWCSVFSTQELCRHEPYEDALGIKSVSWNSSGSMLAVGSYGILRHLA